MTTLAPQDAHLMFNLLNNVTFFAHQKHPVAGVTLHEPDDLQHADVNIGKLQDNLFAHPELIDAYIKEDPFHQPNAELAIIRSWKHFVRGRFLLMKHLRDYSVFLREEKGGDALLFGVKGLTDPLDFMFGEGEMLSATFIPFRDVITYTGVFGTYNVTLGWGILGRYKELYRKAKLTQGIITSLPYDPATQGKNDEEVLRGFLRSWKNRERYAAEIADLSMKSERLQFVYAEETNKLYAKDLKKDYKRTNLTGMHVAILQGMTVAVAKDARTLEKRIRETVPKEKERNVYVFRV